MKGVFIADVPGPLRGAVFVEGTAVYYYAVTSNGTSVVPPRGRLVWGGG